MPRVILLVNGCTEALTKVWMTSKLRLSPLTQGIFLEVVKKGLEEKKEEDKGKKQKEERRREGEGRKEGKEEDSVLEGTLGRPVSQGSAPKPLLAGLTPLAFP